MTEDEVNSHLGQPTSVAQSGDTKYLEYESYEVDIWYGNRHSYKIFYVRLINGKVDSFGRKGDFNSTKNPTTDINIHQKVENTNSSVPPAPNHSKTTPFDLEAELSKLNKMKQAGLLSEEEYQQLRQQALNKAKTQ